MNDLPVATDILQAQHDGGGQGQQALGGRPALRTHPPFAVARAHPPLGRQADKGPAREVLD
ncbi:MAG: hypothetical protein GVY30_07525 [Chloroflexi bacterium]|nr:hypothetical protein [Chloroflexota bacterium]